MATANSTSRPRRRSKSLDLVLTPALFAELDAIARTEAGSALEVVQAEDMPDAIARVSPLVGSGYIDARVMDGVCMMDLSIIQIANRIEVDEVSRWNRPELDYSIIQPQDFYHFALWHEIGHRLDNLRAWDSHGGSLDHLQLLIWLNEIRADRLAWHKLYPDRPVPMLPHAIARAAKTTSEMAAMEKRFPHRARPPKPLPPDAVPRRTGEPCSKRNSMGLSFRGI